MTNQSPSWMRNLARKAASSSTSSSASTAASSMPAMSTSAVSTSATTSSAAATCPTASSVSTGTSACSTTSTPCPRSAGWSAETSEVHCSDTLITHFLILERWLLLAEGEGDQPVDQLVESPYVHHDSRNEEDDDARISHQLVPGRTNDLAKLVQDLADEEGDRREEPAHRVAPPGRITARSTGASGACRARHGHSSSLLMVPGTRAPRHLSHPTSLPDLTFCLSRSVGLSHAVSLSHAVGSRKVRRAGGTRTPNRRFWRPMLYQLSHCPLSHGAPTPFLVATTHSG